MNKMEVTMTIVSLRYPAASQVLRPLGAIILPTAQSVFYEVALNSDTIS